MTDTLAQIHAGDPLASVARRFFHRASVERWSDLELGWAIQAVFVARATHYPAWGTPAQGLHEAAIEELALHADMVYSNSEKQERVYDIITESLALTPNISVQRAGSEQRLTFFDYEKTLTKTAAIEPRLQVLEMWGQAIAHYTDANAMARGALIARMMDLAQLNRFRPLPPIDGYTSRVHRAAVLGEVPTPIRPHLQALTQASLGAVVSLGDTLGGASGQTAPKGTDQAAAAPRPSL